MSSSKTEKAVKMASLFQNRPFQIRTAMPYSTANNDERMSQTMNVEKNGCQRRFEQSNACVSKAAKRPSAAAAVLPGESGGSAATRRRNLKQSASGLAKMSRVSSMPCAACLLANGARIRAGPFRVSRKGPLHVFSRFLPARRPRCVALEYPFLPCVHTGRGFCCEERGDVQ